MIVLNLSGQTPGRRAWRLGSAPPQPHFYSDSQPYNYVYLQGPVGQVGRMAVPGRSQEAKQNLPGYVAFRNLFSLGHAFVSRVATYTYIYMDFIGQRESEWVGASTNPPGALSGVSHLQPPVPIHVQLILKTKPSPDTMALPPGPLR